MFCRTWKDANKNGKSWVFCDYLKDISMDRITTVKWPVIFPSSPSLSGDKRDSWTFVSLVVFFFPSCGFYGLFHKIIISCHIFLIFSVSMILYICLRTKKFKIWKLRKTASLSFSCSAFSPPPSIICSHDRNAGNPPNHLFCIWLQRARNVKWRVSQVDIGMRILGKAGPNLQVTKDVKMQDIGMIWFIDMSFMWMTAWGRGKQTNLEPSIIITQTKGQLPHIKMYLNFLLNVDSFT